METTDDYKVTKEQLRALGSPLRIRVLQAFREQPRSVAEAAMVVGVPEKSLYYHVTALEKVGLLVKAEQRHLAKKPQWTYTAPHKSLRINPDLSDPEMAEIAEKNILSLLRNVGLEYKRSVANFGNGSNDMGLIMRRSLVLPPDQVHEFRQRLAALVEEYPEAETGVRISFTTVLNPVEIV